MNSISRTRACSQIGEAIGRGCGRVIFTREKAFSLETFFRALSHRLRIFFSRWFPCIHGVISDDTSRLQVWKLDDTEVKQLGKWLVRMLQRLYNHESGVSWSSRYGYTLKVGIDLDTQAYLIPGDPRIRYRTAVSSTRFNSHWFKTFICRADDIYDED